MLGEAAAEPYFNMWYLAVLAAIHIAQGRAREAVEIAERACMPVDGSSMCPGDCIWQMWWSGRIIGLNRPLSGQALCGR
jgi:hypothetical protein